jgi:hypothetical protein
MNMEGNERMKLEYGTEEFFIELYESEKQIKEDIDYLIKLWELRTHDYPNLEVYLLQECITVSCRLKKTFKKRNMLNEMKKKVLHDESR